jgi:2-phosphosulfolactate phosphatase
MKVDVLFLPTDAAPEAFEGKAVAVFDVLRATTTMTAALAAGVREIRLFPTIESAQMAARDGAMSPPPILCGERNCLRPEGFDFGNSPAEMLRPWSDRQSLFMCTTNGTRAVIAARGAAVLFTAAVVNASAVARAVAHTGLDVILLCAGLKGEVALEDLIGAGAVIAAMGQVELLSDRARIARRLFDGATAHLREALAESSGGRNVLANGLGRDIDFAAQLDRFDVVGRVDGKTLAVSRMGPRA